MAASKTFLHHINQTLIPLFLLITTPNFIIVLEHLIIEDHSSFQFAKEIGIISYLCHSWNKAISGICKEAILTVVALALWGVASLLFLGGKEYTGPPDPSGHVPKYYDSGWRFYILSMAAFSILFIYPGYLSPLHWFKLFLPISAIFVIFGIIFAMFLYLKGRISPSAGDHGSSGNIIFDYYWGLELYPKVFGNRLDLKMWTNCRFGMIIFQFVVLLSCLARKEMTGTWDYSMLACTILQTVYIAKFYWWEDGYANTLDIILDRAGFYICFGCIAFLPTVYTVTSQHMVYNSPEIPLWLFVVFMVVGICVIFLNYFTDLQKKMVRETKGKCKIWGKNPRVIKAAYKGIDGKKRTNLLLASGFWGLARHINYLFDFSAMILWCLPSLTLNPVAHISSLVLFTILVHRSYRDDFKCREKYKQYWDEYCKIVKWKIVPGIF